MPDPEASSRTTDSRSASGAPLPLRRQLFYYVVVGGVSVVVDVGLLALLHEFYGVPLGVATSVAFCTAVVVNFLLNRTAMSSRGSRGLASHAWRYGSLVVANYVITLAVVTTAGHVNGLYLVAKLAVVAGSTSWNFLLYRHWVFTTPRPASSKQDRVPWIGRNPRHRDGRSADRSRQMLVVVPAYNDEEQDPGREHQS
jgi:putative flippase GtrA